MCVNPDLKEIKVRYNTLLETLFGDKAGNITNDDWEQKCLDPTIDSATMSGMVCKLRQLLLQLHYLDLIAKEEVDGTH